LRGFWRQQYGYGRGAALFRRRAQHVPVEPSSFYLDLVRYASGGAADRRKLSALLVLSQVANAVGFASESVRLSAAGRR
jgi:hypothetical protein